MASASSVAARASASSPVAAASSRALNATSALNPIDAHRKAGFATGAPPAVRSTLATSAPLVARHAASDGSGRQ